MSHCEYLYFFWLIIFDWVLLLLVQDQCGSFIMLHFGSWWSTMTYCCLQRVLPLFGSFWLTVPRSCFLLLIVTHWVLLWLIVFHCGLLWFTLRSCDLLWLIAVHCSSLCDIISFYGLLCLTDFLCFIVVHGATLLLLVAYCR